MLVKGLEMSLMLQFRSSVFAASISFKNNHSFLEEKQFPGFLPELQVPVIFDQINNEKNASKADEPTLKAYTLFIK